ncbi:MAG: IS256 family transposase [Planctomycetota bacterium]
MKNSKRTTAKRQPRRRRSREKESTTEGPRLAVRNFRQQLRELLLEQIRGSVAATAHQLVEDEVQKLVGEPWSRKGDSPLRRGGSAETRIFLGGEPVILPRTRVRDQDANTEHPLETVDALRSRDALDEEVKGLLIRGVSTRNYEGALTNLSEGLGLKRSAVSSAFSRASQKDLDALNGRSLEDWSFVAIFLDGLTFKDHTCVAALGVALDGKKRILGVREGATENAALVTDLLANLDERGLKLTSRTLVIIDGSKALRSAVRKSFGRHAVVQRCVLHKKRNVLSYLPKKWQAEAGRRLSAAWSMSGYDEAKEELMKVHAWMKGLNESAAASLAEGMEETLTIHRLGITGSLRKTLISTNPIESAFDIVTVHARRVKRWSGSSMVMRWVGSGLVRAEGRFRRVRGYTAIPKLVAALETLSLTDAMEVA